MLHRKLPLVGKTFQELGLLGRVSYIASAVMAILGAITAVWTFWGWADKQLSLAEKTALWEAQSTLYVELKDTDENSPRYAILEERIQILEEALKD